MNKDNFIQVIQGKQIIIEMLNLECEKNQLILELYVNYLNQKSILRFENISEFSISQCSYPFIIQGFEVINNSEKGWQKEVRYEIHDFEEDKIRFYCETLDVIESV